MMLIDEDTGLRPATPWHLWCVGGLAVLWNAFGAYAYILTQTRNEAYFAAMSADEIALLTGAPLWANIAYAIAIWGALLGSVLLLFKNRLAAPVFAASLGGMAISFFDSFVLSGAGAIMGAADLVFSAVIVGVAVALLLYARAMERREVLS